jgi:hypothetical protein
MPSTQLRRSPIIEPLPIEGDEARVFYADQAACQGCRPSVDPSEHTERVSLVKGPFAQRG